MEYDVIVIGAGIGGLVAALKLSAAGRRVLVLEKQPLPGGLATGFWRKGIFFESALHCADSLEEGGDVRKFLDVYGVTQNLEFVPLKHFTRVIYPEHDFVLDFNFQHYLKTLKKYFPGQEKQIKGLFLRFEKFYRSFDQLTATDYPFWLQSILHPQAFWELFKISSLTAGRLISEYIKDTRLRPILTDIWRFAGLPPEKLCALYFLLIFRGYYYNPTAYVKGGFIQLFQAMVRRIEELGCRVEFKTTVTQIVTAQDKRYKYVVTDKPETFKAKAIIANANSLDVLTKLIDDSKLKHAYAKNLADLEKSISAFQVYLALSVPAKDLGMDHFMFFINNTYDHQEDYQYSLNSDYDNCSLSLVDHLQIDPSLAPQGKGTLLVMALDNYRNWQGLAPEQYHQKKAAVTRKIIQRAEKYLPGLSSYIEFWEAATPLTIARFGSSPEGAIYGFAQTLNQAGLMRLGHQTRVKGLFLAGAWTQPGAGMHGCFVSGIDAADLVLRYLG